MITGGAGRKLKLNDGLSVERRAEASSRRISPQDRFREILLLGQADCNELSTRVVALASGLLLLD